MASLQNYLKQLNSAETQWGIWVNPENFEEEYRIGQYCFENGGLNDGWVCIGNLEQLSFGFQSTYDAIKQWLENNDGEFEYNGRTVRVDVDAIAEAYGNGNLDEDFNAFLEGEAESIKEEWAKEESEGKISELHEFFAPGGEYEEQCKQAELEAEAWAARY